MAYSYEDWEQSATLEEIVSNGLKHLAEISAQIGPDVSDHGASRSNAVILAYRAQVKADLKPYQNRLARKNRPMVSAVRFRSSS